VELESHEPGLGPHKLAPGLHELTQRPHKLAPGLHKAPTGALLPHLVLAAAIWALHTTIIIVRTAASTPHPPALSAHGGTHRPLTQSTSRHDVRVKTMTFFLSLHWPIEIA
jgi:hypothetical protein